MKKIILSLGLFLAFSQCLHAQWTLGTSNNVYTTNAPNTVTIGGAIPTTINATAPLFPSAIPKMEIISGAVSTTYSDLITIRHTGIASDLVSRQMGMVFKLSSEGSLVESSKMGGILVESSNGYANNPTLSLLTANARRLTIDYYGNLGVGITTPRALFDIGKPLASGALGVVLARLPEGNDIGSGTYLGIKGYDTQTSSTTPNVYNVKSFAIEHSFYGKTNSAISFLRGGAEEGGSIAFSTNNNTEKMRILYNGNVGIGITNPQNKLDVNGTIHSKAVNIDLNGWPDYVFQKDYQLPSLQEVKAYIDQNQHLPEIPSEQQIAKEGLNLGEMNKLLMKKVEELTLYLIETDKKNEVQNEKIIAQNRIAQKQARHIEVLEKQVNMLLQKLSN